MADPRFFKKTEALTIGDIAALTNIENADGLDHSLSFSDVAALDVATKQDISFLDNIKYKDSFRITKAGAVLVHPDLADLAPDGTIVLMTSTPYKSYALVAQAFYPQSVSDGDISGAAHITGNAQLGENVSVAAGAVIEDGAIIGANTIIGPNAVVSANVEIGANCRIGAGATLSHCIVGSYVSIYTGCRIGQDGFGFAIDPAGFVKVPQLGRVIIGDHVEIGANTTIDRGAGPDTEIGAGTWIDNLVQIGHNVKIGRGCVIVAQCGIAGSTVLDDYVVMGGQVGIAGHLHIGKGVRIGAQSGIMRDVPPGQEVMGSPAVPGKQFLKQAAILKKLSTKS